MLRRTESRDAVQAMLLLREKVDRGEMADGRDADAAATRAVMAAFTRQ